MENEIHGNCLKILLCLKLSFQMKIGKVFSLKSPYFVFWNTFLCKEYHVASLFFLLKFKYPSLNLQKKGDFFSEALLFPEKV